MYRTIRNSDSAVTAQPFTPASSTDAVLAATTDRPYFAEGHALIILDVENLMLSARDLGMAIDFAALQEALVTQNAPTPVTCHAVYTGDDANNRLADALAAMGWCVTVRPPILTGPPQHRRRHSNSDTWFAFLVADLLRRDEATSVVLGTGDGQLGLDLARCVRAMAPGCAQIMTLSLPGSTSRLLNSRVSREIDRNLEIGRDVLRTLY